MTSVARESKAGTRVARSPLNRKNHPMHTFLRASWTRFARAPAFTEQPQAAANTAKVLPRGLTPTILSSVQGGDLEGPAAYENIAEKVLGDDGLYDCSEAAWLLPDYYACDWYDYDQ